MADYRRHFDEYPRRLDREFPDRAGDEVRPWSGDRSRQPRGHDDRYYHEQYRAAPRYGSHDAADEYYRAAREQRADFLRWEAQSPGADVEHHDGPNGEHQAWMSRERGGYWRQYEDRAPFAGRGPKNYQRSDERIQEQICDCMTDDPLLDASDIEVQVSSGVVTLTGTVMSRDQKRRAEDVAEHCSGVKDVTNQLRVSREANGHAQTATPPVSQRFTETPSKSTSGNSA